MAAGVAQAAVPTDLVLLHPTAAVWRGAAPAVACAPGRALRVSNSRPPRSGVFLRSTVLVAEIAAPEPIAARVALQARACAEAVAGDLMAAAFPLEASPATPGFAPGFEACLQRADAARYVRTVTLWVDNDCAL